MVGSAPKSLSVGDCLQTIYTQLLHCLGMSPSTMHYRLLNLHVFFFPSFITKFHRLPPFRLTKLVLQPTSICLSQQSPMFPSTNQNPFILFTLPRVALVKFFLFVVESPGATFQSVLRKRLSWSHSSRSESMTYGMSLYVLICTHAGRVIQA